MGRRKATADIRPTLAGLSSTFARVQPNGRVWAVGDSITAHVGLPNGQVDAGTPALYYGKEGWTTHALLASQARWTWAGILATGGYTPEQIQSVHAPIVVARSRPGDMVIVFAGTNGNNATNTIALHDYFRAAGLNTIVVLIPPSGAGTLAGTRDFNRTMAEYAASIGAPVLDTHGLLVDRTTGLYQAALTSDGVHPTLAGHAVIGQAAATLLNGIFAEAPDPLVRHNAAMTGQLCTKPLALDSPVDGTDYGRHALSGTAGPVADADFVGGSCYEFAQTDSGVAYLARSGQFALTPGNTYRMGMHIKATRGAGGLGRWQIMFGPNGVAYWAWGLPSNGGAAEFAAEGKFYLDIPLASDAPVSSAWRFRFDLSNDTGVIKVGQLTCQDLGPTSLL